MRKIYGIALLLFTFSVMAEAKIDVEPSTQNYTDVQIIDKALKQSFPERSVDIVSVIRSGKFSYNWLNEYVDFPLSVLTGSERAYKIKVIYHGCQPGPVGAAAFITHGYDSKNQIENNCLSTVKVVGEQLTSYLTNSLTWTIDMVVDTCNP